MIVILGIKLDKLNSDELMKKIKSFISSNKQHYVVTPNPEIILKAHQDEEFFYVLNQADLSLPDGFGLIMAARIFGQKLIRLTGSDTTPLVLKMAEREGYKVVILNRQDGLSTKEEINDTLLSKFSQLNFKVLDIKRDTHLSEEALERVNNYGPVILFNTLGFPYQEKLMYHNLEKLPSVKVAFGIGGSFDYLSGRINRGPKILRKLGLEWFWRLLNIFRFKNSGHRLKRIYQATIVFTFKVLKTRFILPFLYRSNVLIFLYKLGSSGVEVLIVEREDESGHWQLPQGGIDGESLLEAGKRELREELGTDNFLPKAVFKNIHRYKFPSRNEKNKRYRYEYKGQKQGLFVAEFLGHNEEIKINFWDHQDWRWEKINNLENVIHPVRKIGLKKALERFNSLNKK